LTGIIFAHISLLASVLSVCLSIRVVVGIEELLCCFSLAIIFFFSLNALFFELTERLHLFLPEVYNFFLFSASFKMLSSARQRLTFGTLFRIFILS